MSKLPRISGKECIKACKYGTYKKKGDEYLWNDKKCRFYSTLKTITKANTTYGPCNGDCINVCPIGNGSRRSSEVSYDKSVTVTLDEIMDEIKPYFENSQDNEYLKTKIQEIFDKKSFKPVNYDGLTTESSFAVWITNEELEKNFQCKKIWVELSSRNINLFNKIYDLRDVLNHEWAILVLNEDGTYNFYRPLIWSKIQGIKGFVKQI